MKTKSLFLRLFVIVFSLNIFFILLHYGSTYISKQTIRDRVLKAFDNGELAFQDWPEDMRIGKDQYSDCSILRTVLFETGNHFHDAIGPLKAVSRGRSNCKYLFDVASGKETESEPLYYHRIWYGSRVLTSFFLFFSELSTTRNVLMYSNYVGYLAIGLIAWSIAPTLFWTLLPILIYGLFFSGLPFYGQSLCHAPGYLTGLLGAISLLLMIKHRSSSHSIYLIAAVIGCWSYFFDIATALPFIAIFLFVLIYLSAPYVDGLLSKKDHFRFATLAIFSWCGGVLGSLFLKQALAVSYFGSQVLDDFVQALKNRAGMFDPSVVESQFSRLYQSFKYLTWGFDDLGQILFFVSCFIWLWAVIQVLWDWKKLKELRQGYDLLAVSLCVVAIFFWYLIFSNHTRIHAWFTVRYASIPLSLGWILLIMRWQAIWKRNISQSIQNY